MFVLGLPLSYLVKYVYNKAIYKSTYIILEVFCLVYQCQLLLFCLQNWMIPSKFLLSIQSSNISLCLPVCLLQFIRSSIIVINCESCLKTCLKHFSVFVLMLWCVVWRPVNIDIVFIGNIVWFDWILHQLQLIQDALESQKKVMLLAENETQLKAQVYYHPAVSVNV